MQSHNIRLGNSNDLHLLQDIERRAGRAFADIGMQTIAEDEPPSITELAGYSNDGRLWVATDSTDRPVAYALVDLIDDCAHIEQVSVDPEHAGQRLGQALIDAVSSWAATRKLKGLTLTTFAEVPWNAPYYHRLGFEILSETQLTPGLQSIRQGEREHGLDRWPRVCMKRSII